MDKQDPSRLTRWGVRVSALISMLIGAFWLVAWLGGLAHEWSAAQTIITVKTNMALCQLLSGIALLLLQSGSKKIQRILGLVLAACVFILGLLSFGEHLFRLNIGIDELLAREAPGALATASPNRMGPPGAVSLMLLGAGLLAVAGKRNQIARLLEAGAVRFLTKSGPADELISAIRVSVSRSRQSDH